MATNYVDELMGLIAGWRANMTPMPDEIRLTQGQWDDIRFRDRLMPGWPADPAGIRLWGIPAVLVGRDEDSTFHQERIIREINESWVP